MLAVAERDGLPCALTSTNGRNVPFYERNGLRVVAGALRTERRPVGVVRSDPPEVRIGREGLDPDLYDGR